MVMSCDGSGEGWRVARGHYSNVSRFRLITLNDREARFLQPKLELYGLYRALRSLKLYLIGVRNIIIKVDAKYIKGMLEP